MRLKMLAFEDAGGSIRNFRKLCARMCLGSALRPAPVSATTMPLSAKRRGVAAVAEASEAVPSTSGSRQARDLRGLAPASAACSLSRRGGETSGSGHDSVRLRDTFKPSCGGS